MDLNIKKLLLNCAIEHSSGGSDVQLGKGLFHPDLAASLGVDTSSFGGRSKRSQHGVEWIPSLYGSPCLVISL